jgi:CMP-N-acetylneuraminic acid synthetase
MTKPKVIAIIPARGGSVRIPKKNIKMLNGIPVLAYTIRAAQKSKYVDRVIVSTDCDDIKAVALKWGAEVPFRRPADISEDVPTEDVVIHAVKWLKENENLTSQCDGL